MDFTEEQEAIFSSSGDIKINAVAGSGKTTALIEYAKRQPSSARILYLVFNRSVKIEAQKRFDERGISNVDVQTAHSLAFRRVAIPGGYKVTKGYKIHDAVALLGLSGGGRDPHAPYVIASHLLKLVSLFCNGTCAKVNELDYCASIADPAARSAVKRYYDQIENGARLFLAKMDRKEIDATHDFYLKKFQLSNPRLPYDLILFDEGQDASPVMLDVFLAQRARKVIVGDVHQQIYGWRHAINALRNVDFPSYSLTTSFRFNDHVARLAMECLGWKRHLGELQPVTIKGVGVNKKIHSRATVARTNLALLKRAIDLMQERSVRKIYFEGNINSYTYAADGASIYDVLNLSLNKRDRIRDPLIASMQSFEQLREYQAATEDMELGMLIDIVEEYGKEIPFLLKRLTELHVADDEREKADMVFSTLHRCKGMEYDAVTLTDDFITEARVRKLTDKDNKAPIDRDRLSEEINLAYVAVTRSKNFLDFPEAMFPEADPELFTQKKITSRFKTHFKKLMPFDDKRKFHANAYQPWTHEDDLELEKMFLMGKTEKAIAERFGRKPSAIRSRLKKLGCG
jgi:F-box protein, helicase, 18